MFTQNTLSVKLNNDKNPTKYANMISADPNKSKDRKLHWRFVYGIVYTTLECSKFNESQDKRVKKRYRFVSCKKKPTKKLVESHNFNRLGRVFA